MDFKKLGQIDNTLKKKREETVFFVKNLLKGFLMLAIIVVAYVLLKDRIDPENFDWLRPFYERPIIVYAIFIVSEVLIGIIPPEFFMIWATRHDDVNVYIYLILILTVVSFAAGIIGYWIGRYFNRTRYYRLLKRRFFGKYEKYLIRFGGFLIIVASLTPLPFSGIAMLVGSIRYPFRKYLYFSAFRFLRFAAYSYVIWQAHTL
jgi:membrane protein YqaA with SNARE-associated domain